MMSQGFLQFPLDWKKTRIPFPIVSIPPAKLDEQDWKAYNIEQTSHLRRAYYMVKERDRVQRQKAARLYNFRRENVITNWVRSFSCTLQRASRITIARSCFDGLVLIVF